MLDAFAIIKIVTTTITTLQYNILSPIQLEYPRYSVIVPVRAFGQSGIRVKEPRLFLETLIRNLTSFLQVIFM
ncbi:MAG TPA: hypothetical protein DEG28_08895 [Porphyromonadaceae bacterium]|nr:hypothetical protein [Porphyromonadaceae bacterium]HBX20344.1 hypothetical protein [Porphyromonadaceae bacterium]HBX45981.1 hypothetical protein [Porphyromonadaceae bacterium]HCM21845.1 hypothetical protein [Porphyromonadaceae bacterium]